MSTQIIKAMYNKLTKVQISWAFIYAVNSMADTAIFGRFLGTDALAAAGLFSPVITVMGLSAVMTAGVQILCSHAIGSGEREKVVSLFSTGFTILTVCGIIVSAACMIFRENLILILTGGINDSPAIAPLRGYINGYSCGITFQVLYEYLRVFLSFNNAAKFSNISVVIMLVSNAVLDIAFVYMGLGAFGIGFATSISYLLAFMVVMPRFLSKYKAVHIGLGNLCLSHISDAMAVGLPSLMSMLGLAAKGYIMNVALMRDWGDAAVAVLGIQNSIYLIAMSVPRGLAAAFTSLGGLYYGEEDRDSLLALVKYALKLGVMLSGAAMLVIMAGSYHVSGFFFGAGSEAFSMCVRMMLLFPSFFVFNTVFNIMIKAYQVQGKTRMINILSFADSIIMAVIAVIFIPLIGDSAVWLSFPLAEIVCLLVIAVSVFVSAGKITFSLPEWLGLPENFGAKASDFMEFCVTSMHQVINISQRVIDFCLAHAISRRKSNIAGLAIEEMAGNIVRHGFRDGRNNYVDLRIVDKGELKIRLRDNCPEFDPQKRLDQFFDPDPAANIGMRMIARLADKMNYEGMAGININTIWVKLDDNR